MRFIVLGVIRVGVKRVGIIRVNFNKITKKAKTGIKTSY